MRGIGVALIASVCTPSDNFLIDLEADSKALFVDHQQSKAFEAHVLAE